MKINGYEDYTVESNGTVKNKKSKIIKHNITKNGYAIVRLSKEHKQKAFSVHRLVAIHHIENNKKERDQVNHIDGDKLNNDISNLEWCTKSENTLHAFKNGLMEKVRKKTKETIRKVAEARSNISIDMASELAEMKDALNITYTQMSEITGFSRDVLFKNINGRATYYNQEVA